MKKFLLLTSVGAICFAGNAFAVDCRSLPDCEEYGYTLTASDCAGRASLKCPFDYSKLFCVPDTQTSEPEPEPEPEPETPPAASTALCYVGAVLYSDLQCYDGTPNLEAIGVVYDVNQKLAVSVEKTDLIRWSPRGAGYQTIANLGTDGFQNTKKIVEAFSSYTGNLAFAARYCYSQQTGTQNWFLPSLEQLRTLGQKLDTVNATLQNIGKSKIDGWLWASNESSDFEGSLISMPSFVMSATKDQERAYARCVLNY